MKKDTLVSLSRIARKTARATSARSCTKTLLLAAAVGLALGTAADLHADWTVPGGEAQYGYDYDASSGTITVQPSTDALVQDGDISPNNYIISGGGSPAFFRNPGALNIRYNALVTGNVSLVGESVISSQVTGYRGSTGTLSGNLIGTARLTIGSWDLSLSAYNTAAEGAPGSLPLDYDAHVGAHPLPGEEAAARSTFILLGENSGFTGDIRVAPFTTLQIGDGTDSGRGNLRGNNNILLTTDWKYDVVATPKLSNSTLIFNTASYTTEGVTFSGNISGSGAVIKRATGLLTLSGMNTFNGDLSVEAGQLAFTSLNALGARIPNRKISLSAGTTLSYVGTDLLLDFTSDLTLELVNRGSATLSVAPNTEIILHRLSGGAGRQLNKTGNGTLTLAGTQSNPGAGFIVTTGTLNLAKTDGAYAIASGGLTINDAGKVVVTEVNTSSQLASSALVTFAGNGSFDLNGHSETFGGLEGAANRAANSRVFNSQSTPVTLAIGGANLLSTEFAGKIEGDVSLEKTGSGILILSGANNTYTGTTTVNAGILQVGSGINHGTIGGEANFTPVIVNAAGSLAFNRSVTSTFDRDIIGDGNLIKSGSGLLRLNGDNAYTGITTVNAGALEFGTPSATTAIRVASGARLIPFGNDILTLSGNATSYAGHTGNTALPNGNKDIEGGLIITGGHTFSVGAADVVATLDIQSSLELNAGKLALTVGVGEGGSVVNDKINVTALNVSAGTDASSKFAIDLNFTDGVQAAPNGLEKTIIHWTDGATLNEATLISQFKITPDPATFNTPRDGANPMSIHVSVDSANSNLLLTFEGEGNHSLSWRSSGGTNWSVPDDYASVAKTWFDQTAESRGEATTTSAFYDYDLVRFDSASDDSGTSGNVIISSVVRPSRITVTGSNKIYVFSNQGGGKITGDTGIIMNSSRGLRISGANDFTGVVEITNGKVTVLPTATTLALGGNGQASALGAGSGAGSILLDRGGALLFDKGTTTVNAIVTSRSFTLGTTGGSSSQTTASIEIGDADAAASAPSLVFFNGTDPVAFRGDGDRTFGLGGVAGTPAAAQAQDFVSNQERGGGVFQLPLNDPFSGKLSLVKSGTGIWFLQPIAANAYSGGTTISGGTLSIATVDALGLEPGTFAAANLTINGGTLANYKYVGDGTVDVSGQIPVSEIYFTAHDLIFGENRGISIGAGGAVFEVGNATDGSSGDLSIRRVTLDGVIAGTTKLIKTGEGILRINAVNTTLAGVFAVEKGTVEIGNSNALGASASGVGIYLGTGTTLDLQGHDLSISKFLNKTVGAGTTAPLAASYAPTRSTSGLSTGTILNEVEKSGNVILTLGATVASDMEVSSFSGTIRELDARVSSVTVINPDTNVEETRNALTYPSPIALIKRGPSIFNLELAPGSNFTGTVTVEGGLLRLGLGISENPIGNATSIIVKNGAVLDLYGNQILDSVLKDQSDAEILLDDQPITLHPTLYIEGEGRKIMLLGADNQGVAESDRFQGWTGALTSLVPHVEPPVPATPGNPGSPGTPQPTGSYAGDIVLTNNARISTALSFGLGKIRGTGTLTLSSLIGSTQYDTVLENDPEKFYIKGINLDGSLNDNGIYLLSKEGAYAQDAARLLVQTKLAVTAGTTAIVVPGGIAIGASETSVGRLVLNGVDLPTNTWVFDADFETGNAAGKMVPPLSLSATGATLVLADNTRQLLNYFWGANAATYVTHEGIDSGTLILDTPLALPTIVPDLTAAPVQYFQYAGKIGSEPLPAGAAEDAVVPPTSKQVNLIKRGPGTFTLSGSNSDYEGYTYIEGGVLELAAPLTVAAADDSSNATGVLGSPDNPDAGSLRILDGSTLRDVSTTRSETRRLFLMSGTATIESSGAGANPTTPGLQFLGTGRIEFESANRNAELVLGGNKSPANNLTSLNRFAPSLTDPSSSHAFKLSLRKTGTGTWQIEGNNTYTGTTYIEQGTLILGSSSALPAGTSVQLGNSSGYSYAGAVLQLNGNSVTLENPVSIGDYYSAWQNRIINGLAGSIPTLTLNVSSDSASYDFAGSLGQYSYWDVTSNTFNLVKTGPGTQTLSGALYYTGDTEIREGTLRLSGFATFASNFIFVTPPDGTPEPDSAPQLDTEGIYALYVNTGTTLVAGNPAKVVSYRDVPEGGGLGTMRYRVEINTRTDLQGKIYLAGGTLFIGGTKASEPAIGDDGSIIGNRTVVKDNVIGSAVTIAGWLDAGGLYSEEDTVSTINFTFGTKAIIAGQDTPEDLIERATAKFPVSDLLRVGILRFDGPVVIMPFIPSGGDLGGYRLQAGTVTSPANYALIRYTTPPSADTVANIEYGLRDPRYIISFVNSVADSTIYMSVVASDIQNQLFWLGSPFTNWGDPLITGSNFIQAGVGVTSFSSGDHAFFDDRVTDAARRIVTVVPEGIQLGAATFNNSLGHDYTLTGGSLIDVLPNDAGETPEQKGYLEKLGTGTLYINNANTYSGGTILGGGRIVVANLLTGNPLGTGPLFLQGGTLSSSANFTITNEVNVQGTAAIETSLTANITIAGQILDGTTGGASASGNGVLVKTGPGKLLLQGDASQFSGTVRVDEDTVILGQNAKPEKTNFILNSGTTLTANYDTTTENHGEIFLGNLAGTGTITNTTLGAKTFIVGSRGTLTDESPSVFSGVISDGLNGAVSFVKVGTGTLVFAGLNPGNYSGGTTVESGVLQIGYNNRNGSLGLGDILLATEGTLRFNGDRTESANLVNKISGTGTLVKQNTNTLLILNDNSDFHGKIVIENGELRVGDNTGTGSIGDASVVNDATLIFNRGGGDYTLTNAISGSGDIQKVDAGKLTYLGENTSTGQTLVYSGIFAIGDGSYAQDLNYGSSTLYLRGSVLELNPGLKAKVVLGSNITGTSGTIRQNGPGDVYFSGTATFAGNVNIEAGRFHIGNGGDSGNIEGSAQIHVNSGAELWINRSGTVNLSGRIFSSGRIVLEGGADGTGTTIFSENNEISGTISVSNKAILQIGNGGRTGSFNSTKDTVNVQLANGTNLAYNLIGEDVTTGESVVIVGGGSFVKLGTGTLTFNSIANHTGGTIVENGRLIMDTTRLPRALLDPAYNPNHTAYLAAEGPGILELRNGSTPFPLEAYIRGTGTIALGADSSLSGGTYTQFDFIAVDAAQALHALEVGASANFHLGSNSYARVNANEVRLLSGGLLTGQATLTGDLHIERGADVRPSSSTAIGTLSLDGNLVSDGNITLDFTRDNITGEFIYDTIHFRGTATFNSGSSIFLDISSIGNDFPETITTFPLIIDDEPWNPEGGKNVIDDSFIQTNRELDKYGYVFNNGRNIVLLASKYGAGIWDIPGLKANLPERFVNFTDYLDAIMRAANDAPNDAARLDPMKTVNALLLYRDGPLAAVSVTAPSALAALTASPISSAHEAAATMRSHLESIRYDRVINARRVRGSDLTGDPNDEQTLVNLSETGVLAYVSGSASTTKNGSASDPPAFDLNNYAGSVGFDFLLGTGFNVGVNASYNRSHASLHNGGGKVDADTGRASLYASFMPSSRFFFDVQAFGGYTTYKYNRSTALGHESAKPDGYDYGANAYVGTVLSVNEWIHFTPYAGFEFVHTTVDAYTEDGSIAALRVQEVTQDSLLLKIGTGLNWVKPLSKTVSARFTLDAALAVEMLDTDARITAAFANDNSGNRFRFEAPARPERTLQVGPAVELSIGYNQSLSLGYTYEADFNNYTNHHVNATYRLRF